MPFCCTPMSAGHSARCGFFWRVHCSIAGITPLKNRVSARTSHRYFPSSMAHSVHFTCRAMSDPAFSAPSARESRTASSHSCCFLFVVGADCNHHNALKEPRGDVPRHGEQRSVEEKRDDPVHQCEPAHTARGDCHIRGLRGRTDHEREVQEVDVVRLFRSGERETRMGCGWIVVVEAVSVVQCECGVNEGPREY